MIKPLLLTVAVAVCSFQARAAEDTVTIPKSRLEALERKEAELEQLKKAPPTSPQVNTQAAPSAAAPASGHPSVPPVAAPALTREPAPEFPPISSLPALKPGEPVEAGMLAAHFKQDPAAAAKRYNGKILVSGTVAGFDKPLVVRNYKIVLRAPGSDLPVICDFYSSDNYRAVFTSNNGTTLTGMLKNEARVTLSRVGQPVLIEGECRGLSRGSVKLAGCHLK